MAELAVLELERCPCGRPVRDCGPEGCTTIVKAGPAPSRAGGAELRQLARGVTVTARTLRLALATGQRELGERGRVSPEVWAVVDELADTLEAELGELERLRRRAGGWGTR